MGEWRFFEARKMVGEEGECAEARECGGQVDLKA
jgi:hypothetical protein